MIYSIAGILIGAIAGGVFGYIGRCAGGTCPIACTPWGGILVGALIGFLVVSGIQQKKNIQNKEIRKNISKNQSP